MDQVLPAVINGLGEIRPSASKAALQESLLFCDSTEPQKSRATVSFSNPQGGESIAKSISPLEPYFLRYLVGYFGTTLEEYRRTLQRFDGFWASRLDAALDIYSLKREHLLLYAKFLREEEYSSNYQRKTLSILVGFCQFLYRENLIEKDISQLIKRPRGNPKLQTAALTDEQVKKVLSSFRESLHATPMHRAILALGFYTGLRSAEIRNIKGSDFGSLNGLKVLRVKAKGGVQREVPITKALQFYLDSYESQRAEWGLSEGDSFYFVSSKTKTNKKLNPETLRQIFLRAIESAGIEKSELRRYSPHSMRATAITHMLSSKGLPIERVQEAVGHTSISTTKLYDRTGNDPENSVLLEVAY